MTETNNFNTNNNTILNNQNCDTLVKDLVERFEIAFNSHDPKTLGSLLTEDAEWTDVIGHTMIGRKEIEKQHNYPFITELKDAELDVKSFRSKWLGDNNKIVSIDIKWKSSGHRTPDGESILGIRHGLLNFIAIKINGKDDTILKIVLSHNNDYTSTYTQEDRKKVVNKNNTSYN